MHQQTILKSQELHDTMDMGNRGSKEYIEDWFHSIICLQHQSILQQFLASSFQGKLASHTLIFINIHFSNLVMYICYSIISHLHMIHDCLDGFGHPFLQTWTNSLKNSVKIPIRDYARTFPHVYASPARLFHVCH